MTFILGISYCCFFILNLFFQSGYIRIGSNVWARALNGDYYKGAVTALADKVHVKFDNGDTISHEKYYFIFFENIIFRTFQKLQIYSDKSIG